MAETPIPTLVFLDTETTGLDSDRHELWEIASIVRQPDGDTEYCWQLLPSLKTADPSGLRIGRYYERNRLARRGIGDIGVAGFASVHPDLDGTEPSYAVRAQSAHDVAGQLAVLLDGATIVGAVPDFDARFLTRFLRRHHHAPTWHYHLVDVETLAAGALRQAPPWGFDELLAAYGLTYDEADRHTALGDARMVRDLYDAVLTHKPTQEPS